jgi:two-component system, OmpR family, sensor kinase
MSRGISIRLRLSLVYTAVLALTVIAFSAILYATQSQSSYADVKANLVRQAAFFPSGGRPDRSPGERPPDQASGGSTAGPTLPSGALPGRWTQTRDLNGAVTGQTFDLNGATLPLSETGLAAVRSGGGWFEAATVQDEPLLIYSQVYAGADGTSAIVQVASPIGQTQQYLATLRLILIVGSSLAIAVAFALGWLLAGTALRPIQRITQTARAIGAERDFARRVAYQGPADEVGQLAVTFNEMLAELESGYRQLEDALQSQRRFVADASHELRTPLTTVRGNIELLRRTPAVPEPEAAEIMADTTEEVDRLIRLVNQLLALARADAGQPLRREPIPVRALVEDVCRQAKLLSPHTDVRCEPADVLIEGDRDALKQVLLVLVDNALVHTPSGTPVTLAAGASAAGVGAAGVGATSAGATGVGATSAGATGVIFTVSDSGPGIAPETLPHIFERFYRGQASRTGGGAGLGLSIAKELIEAQGGKIAVDSQPGRGTTFTVTMPRAEADD